MIRVVILLLLFAVPAAAQTSYLRDRNQNLLGSIHQNGDRTEFRDKSGNLEGYSKSSNGVTQFYDKAGNRRNQITPH